MRHVVFSREGFDATNLTARVRSLPLPSDANALAYIAFNKNFISKHETYFIYPQRIYYSENVDFSSQSFPETVCYCTTQG